MKNCRLFASNDNIRHVLLLFYQPNDQGSRAAARSLGYVKTRDLPLRLTTLLSGWSLLSMTVENGVKRRLCTSPLVSLWAALAIASSAKHSLGKPYSSFELSALHTRGATRSKTPHQASDLPAFVLLVASFLFRLVLFICFPSLLWGSEVCLVWDCPSTAPPS